MPADPTREEVERRMRRVAKSVDSGFLLTPNAAVSVALDLLREHQCRPCAIPPLPGCDYRPEEDDRGD
jgi:hypothetical protein